MEQKKKLEEVNRLLEQKENMVCQMTRERQKLEGELESLKTLVQTLKTQIDEQPDPYYIMSQAFDSVNRSKELQNEIQK